MRSLREKLAFARLSSSGTLETTLDAGPGKGRRYVYMYRLGTWRVVSRIIQGGLEEWLREAKEGDQAISLQDKAAKIRDLVGELAKAPERACAAVWLPVDETGEVGGYDVGTEELDRRTEELLWIDEMSLAESIRRFRLSPLTFELASAFGSKTLEAYRAMIARELEDLDNGQTDDETLKASSSGRPQP